MGAAAGMIGLVACAMLVAGYLGGVWLPGCGGGCAGLATGAGGRLPVLRWPVSYLGLAYFTGALAAWTVFRGRTGRGCRWFTRLAAVVSVLYLFLMGWNAGWCGYCVAAHAGSLALWAASEWAGGRAVRVRPMAVALGVALLVFGALGMAEALVRTSAAERAEGALHDTTRELVKPAGPSRTGFAGRHARGASPAPIRIVVFMDYQCPECKRIDAEAAAILRERDDVSVSLRHYPFCKDCNANLDTCPHPNACWAARAAEAAGLIAGEQGFQRMHDWLFVRGGGFTAPELDAALPGLGLDRAKLAAAMNGPETLALVRGDVSAGEAVGLRQTPMIFINGVELRGWEAPGALRRAVEALAATNPATGAADAAPPSAIDKYIADWLRQPVRPIPLRAGGFAVGPADARVRVVLWGGFGEPFTAEADGLIRAAAASRTDVRYEFRHFPFDQACNPAVPRTRHPGACALARADEAAASAVSPDRARAFHAALLRLALPGGPADPGGAAAAEAGFDASILTTAIASPATEAVIQGDIIAARSLGITGIPMIFVNGRLVPAWRLEGWNALARIIEAAATRP